MSDLLRKNSQKKTSEVIGETEGRGRSPERIQFW